MSNKMPSSTHLSRICIETFHRYAAMPADYCTGKFVQYVCIAFFTLDVGLLARSQYSEGPATGHLYTGFSRFPCA